MGKCTLCGLNPHATIAVIAVYSIILSLGYIAMSTIGLFAHDCDIDMTQSRTDYAIYLFYFRDDKCGAVDLGILGIPAPLPPMLPPIAEIATRTNIFVLTCLILHSLWLITSLLMLSGSCISCVGRGGQLIFFHPWILVAGSILVYDIVATVYFTIDLVESTTLDGVMNLLEIGNKEQIGPVLESVNTILFTIPSIIMVLAAAKGVLFLVFDLVFFIVMISIATQLWSEDKIIASSSREVLTEHPADPYHQRYPNFFGRQSEMQQRNSNRSYIDQRYLDPAKQRNPSFYDDNIRYRRGNDNFNNRPPVSNYNLNKNVQPRDNVRRSTPTDSMRTEEVLRSYSKQRDSLRKEEVHRQKPNPQPQPKRIEGNNNPRRIVESVRVDTVEEVRSTPTVAQKPSSEIEKETVEQYIDRRFSYLNHPRPSSPVTYQTSETNEKRNSNSHQPNELRSQLPWSYFNNSDDLANFVQNPRKQIHSLKITEEETPPANFVLIQAMRLERLKAEEILNLQQPNYIFSTTRDEELNEYNEDQILPPVPPPIPPPVPPVDYTLHFPRAKRMAAVELVDNRSNISSNDDGKWSGPEYRY